MWALGVIAAIGMAAALVRYFQTRDDVPPMQRHARALEALRDLSENPRPPVDLAVQPDTPIDHVRILDEAPTAARNTRRAARRPTPASTTARSRRTARIRAAASATDRPTIHIRAAALRSGETRTAEIESAEIPGAEIPAVEIPAADIRANPGRTEEPPDPKFRSGTTRRGRGRLAAVSSRTSAVATAIAVVGIALMIVFVAGVGRNGAAPAVSPTTVPTRPRASSVAATTVPRATVPAQAVPVVAHTPNGATVTARAPFLLGLHARGTSWVGITDPTGATLFTTTMHAGQDQGIPVNRDIVVQIGYSPGLTISVDGVAVDLSPIAQTASVDFHTS